MPDSLRLPPGANVADMLAHARIPLLVWTTIETTVAEVLRSSFRVRAALSAGDPSLRQPLPELSAALGEMEERLLSWAAR